MGLSSLVVVANDWWIYDLGQIITVISILSVTVRPVVGGCAGDVDKPGTWVCHTRFVVGILEQVLRALQPGCRREQLSVRNLG